MKVIHQISYHLEENVDLMMLMAAKVSARIAEAVVSTAHEQQVSGGGRKANLRQFIERTMYGPAYESKPFSANPLVRK